MRENKLHDSLRDGGLLPNADTRAVLLLVAEIEMKVAASRQILGGLPALVMVSRELVAVEVLRPVPAHLLLVGRFLHEGHLGMLPEPREVLGGMATLEGRVGGGHLGRALP